MSKHISEKLEQVPASQYDIQILNVGLEQLIAEVKQLNDHVKKEVIQLNEALKTSREKIEALEKFKNMIVGALIISNIFVGVTISLLIKAFS